METLARCLKIQARSSGRTADPQLRMVGSLGIANLTGPGSGGVKAGTVAGVGEADFGPLLCVAQACMCLAGRVELAPQAHIGL